MNSHLSLSNDYSPLSLPSRNRYPDAKRWFELRGIRPGSYHLFAWSVLEGAGYRNAEFMKDFEDRGKPIEIQKGNPISVNLTAF
jgi:hypothetical protein